MTRITGPSPSGKTHSVKRRSKPKAAKMKRDKVKRKSPKTRGEKPSSLEIMRAVQPAPMGSFQRKLEKQVAKLSSKVEHLKQALKSERRVSNDRMLLLQGRFFGGGGK